MPGILRFFPHDLVDPNPYQTRLNESSEHIEGLARDILAHGMMQYPAGRMVDGDTRCELAFGHSRFAAYQLLAKLGHEEFQEFPVNILELDDEQMAVAAWSENEKRRDLNPVERAAAIQRRISEFGWTQQEVAEKLDIDRTSVSNALRLLRLPDIIQENLKSGILTTRQAMSLMPYYELKTDEIARLENQYNDELFDFLQIARNGELSSDTIRERLARYMRFIHPEEQPSLNELPLIAAAKAEIQVISEQVTREREEPEISDQVTSEQDEPEISDQVPSEFMELEEEEADGPSDKEEEISELHHDSSGPSIAALTNEEHAETMSVDRKTPKAETPKAPAAAPAPAPTFGPAVETTLTITWLQSGGVSIGYRKAGEIIPNMIWRGESTLDEIVAVLKGSLGIQ